LIPAGGCRLWFAVGNRRASRDLRRFFLCLGIGCLVAQSVPVCTVVGAAWCAAAAARLISIAVDGSRSWHTFAGIGFEAGVGLSMLAARL
jgi:hypothetical protein